MSPTRRLFVLAASVALAGAVSAPGMTAAAAPPRAGTGASARAGAVADCTGAAPGAGLSSGAGLGVRPAGAAPRAKDTAAPQIRWVRFSPSPVDASTRAKTVTVRARIVDAGSGLDVSGVSGVWGFARSQGTRRLFADDWSTWTKVSGTLTDGVWTTKVTLPRGTPAGKWGVVLAVEDLSGNTASYSPTDTASYACAGTCTVLPTGQGLLRVTGPKAVHRPTLVSLTAPASTTAHVVRHHQDLVFTAVVADSDGWWGPQLRVALFGAGIASPRAPQAVTVLMSHTKTRSTWQIIVSVPRNAPRGQWSLDVRAVDDFFGVTAWAAADRADGTDVRPYAAAQTGSWNGYLTIAD